MRKHLLLIIPVLGIASLCKAQSLSPNVISSTGGIDKTNSISLEWTMGESAVQTTSAEGKIYTEGFHQPELRVIDIVAQNESLSASYTINIAPNPVKSLLTVNIKSPDEVNLFLTLTDLNGKSIASTEGFFKNDSRDVDMSAFASGIYLLHITNSKGDLIKTFKISKL